MLVTYDLLTESYTGNVFTDSKADLERKFQDALEVLEKEISLNRYSTFAVPSRTNLANDTYHRHNNKDYLVSSHQGLKGHLSTTITILARK